MLSWSLCSQGLPYAFCSCWAVSDKPERKLESVCAFAEGTSFLDSQRRDSGRADSYPSSNLRSSFLFRKWCYCFPSLLLPLSLF